MSWLSLQVGIDEPKAVRRKNVGDAVQNMCFLMYSCLPKSLAGLWFWCFNCVFSHPLSYPKSNHVEKLTCPCKIMQAMM